MKHELIEYESDFLEPGYKAVCSCGWQSTNSGTMNDANLLHSAHAEIENGIGKEQTAPQLKGRKP
jgi:hypothetical protein